LVGFEGIDIFGKLIAVGTINHELLIMSYLMLTVLLELFYRALAFAPEFFLQLMNILLRDFLHARQVHLRFASDLRRKQSKYF